MMLIYFYMNISENSVHHFIISNAAIILYEHVDVDINLFQHLCCWYIFYMNISKNTMLTYIYIY